MTKDNSKTFFSLRTKKFKYQWSDLGIWYREKIKAPVKNHPKYLEIRDFIINLLFTCVVCAYVMFAFGFKGYLLKGSGIAVTITVVQQYIVWYYSIKK